MANYENGCMDWNDLLDNDGKWPGSGLLPEGDYMFEVVGFERGRYPGGSKIPPCNKACMTLRVHTANGTVDVHCDLFLHKSLNWKLASFFQCVGLKKSGESVLMDWSKVVGTKGRAHFTQRSYTGKNGRERTVNDVSRFYDYNPADFAEEADGQWMPTDDPLSWD